MESLRPHSWKRRRPIPPATDAPAERRPKGMVSFIQVAYSGLSCMILITGLGPDACMILLIGLAEDPIMAKSATVLRIPKIPKAPKTMLRTPKVVTEEGRCMTGRVNREC